MATVAEAKQVLFYYEANSNEAVRVGVIGVIVGALIPLVGWALAQWVLRPIFCQDAGSSACGSSDMIGYYIAAVLVTAVAVPVLASWGVFRGLLVAVSSLVALWGLQNYMSPLAGGSWLEYGAFSAVLFGLAYVLFYWLMRLRNFGLSLVAALIVVLIVRWALLTT
jgi:hypothetical protein